MTDGAATSWLAHDRENMLAATAAMPDQLQAALDAPRFRLGLEGRPSSVVVLGMGGSGLAGSVLEAFAFGRSPVPVAVVNGYVPPAFVGPGTLVFAVSFSGETEETLEAARASLELGATMVALSSGGSLASLVSGAGGQVLRIPPGIPQPRAGLAAMAAPLLLACEEIGLLEGARRELELAVANLRLGLPELVSGKGEAVRLAGRIGRSIPLVHGASGLASVAARRFKAQVNENAKSPAFFGVQPEVCHNEICGFGQHGDVTRQLLTLVELRLEPEQAAIARRFDLVAELLEEVVGDVVTVRGTGEGELASFFDLVAICDVASLHLAAAAGVDPGPVPVLSELKQRLRDC